MFLAGFGAQGLGVLGAAPRRPRASPTQSARAQGPVREGTTGAASPGLQDNLATSL